jgi:Na+-translocating ferredoxin:NAD+ oxidoreductase RnfD subunit
LLVLGLLLFGELFEKTVRLITKDERKYAPLWIIFITTLILPPSLPIYMVVTSLLFGLVIGIVFFGGHDREIISPVPLIWGFASISFPVIYNRSWVFPFSGTISNITKDVATMPLFYHPIEFIDNSNISIYNFLIGNVPGTPGASMPILLLILGIILAFFRVIDFRLSLSFIISTLFISILLVHGSLSDSIRYLITGNFLLVAIIILPLKRHAPKTVPGSYIVGVLGGIVLMTINTFSSYFDGSLFTVLILNIFTPIIDDAVLSFLVSRRKNYV